MKKLLYLFATIYLCTAVNGQLLNNETILEVAKNIYRTGNEHGWNENDASDREEVVALLEEAVALYPDNAEARYFLGNAYSRLNSRDAQNIVDMNLALMYKAIEQFEKVIALTPKYTGEIIALDPYSKLSSEWGSMALRYLILNKTDSAAWAFREGKKRGAFSNFMLELYKQTLDATSKNAILLSTGDNPFFSLLYLQTIDHYRTDVAVVDVGMLNTNWYLKFLTDHKSIAFDLPFETLDSTDYIVWPESTVTINNFSWTLKPTYYDSYLLRGDLLLLSMLKENKFQREVFFTAGFDETNMLSLKEYLIPLVIVSKLSPTGKAPSFADYKRMMADCLKLSKRLNMNSIDEHRIFDFFRYTLLNNVSDYLKNNEKQKAKELMALLDQYANESEYTFMSDYLQRFANQIRKEIK